MFIKHQISILKWFLKNHVTLKTGVMAAAKNRNKIHFKIQWHRNIILICNIISQYYGFTQGRAETFGGAGAQSIKGAHGTRF